MSVINTVNGIRVQTASDGMLLTNGDGVFVKEIALGELSEEWLEVVDEGLSDFPEEVSVKPKSISKLQAVALLVKTGRYNELMTQLDKDSTGISRILFDAASVLDSESNMVNQLAGALEMSSVDVDSFFVEASKILI